MADTTPEAKRQEVTLKRDLEIGGEVKKAGTKVLLRPDQIERLKKHTGENAYI